MLLHSDSAAEDEADIGPFSSVAPPPPAKSTDADIDRLLIQHERRDLLRFITCGSVDDGKSTLIGRLLYDSKQLFDDQLSALAADSRRSGTQGGALDLALALDGLAAEREQGITIDVAYRFFSTERRGFIVADTPGHEQYTRNMATGASTADLAILLVDARKGLSEQTRRHSLIVSMLGIRHIVVAVNKMDLVGWSEPSFRTIMEEYRAFAAELGFASVVGIPISALSGDNVSARSDQAPWHDGPPLLPYLEQVEVDGSAADLPFRLAVQWVNRPNEGFRGFAGVVSGGAVAAGDAVRILPGGETTRIARIVTYDGDLAVAAPGMSVTLTLADEIDVSRGSVIAALDRQPHLTDRMATRLFWMAKRPVTPGARYLAKIGTQTVGVQVAEVRSRVDLETLADHPAAMLAANDVGDVVLESDRPVAWDPYRDNRDTGGLILIDRESYDTVGLGLVLEEVPAPADARPAHESATPVVRHRVSHPTETVWRSLAKTVSWRFFGTLLTGAGAYVVTGNTGMALSLGAADMTIKLVLFFGHERLWARIRSGTSGETGLRHC